MIFLSCARYPSHQPKQSVSLSSGLGWVARLEAMAACLFFMRSPKDSKIFRLQGLRSSNFLYKADRHMSHDGFTLIEALMTALVLSIAVMFAASMTGIYAGFFNRGRDNTRIDVAVDRDFAELERAGFQYTYCTGEYTWDGRPCLGWDGTSYSPGSQFYYFPVATKSGPNTSAIAFENDCKSGTMLNSLRNAINGGDSALALSADAQGLGITRDDVVYPPVSGTVQPQRLVVTYRRGGVILREKVIIPPAYYWCPDTEAI